MSDVTATVTGLDAVGWKPFPDEENERKARLSSYADRGDTIKLPRSEYERLDKLGAWGPYGAGASAEVTAPGGQPTSQPTDAPGTGMPTPESSESSEGDPADGLDGLTVAKLVELAKDSGVELGSKDTKPEAIAKLRAAGVSAPSE